MKYTASNNSNPKGNDCYRQEERITYIRKKILNPDYVKHSIIKCTRHSNVTMAKPVYFCVFGLNLAHT